MSTAEGDPSGPEPTEEELRAAYEAEIKKIRVEHVLLEQIVTLVNLGMRRTGLAPGTEGERDQEQVHLAIESIRALLPLVEQAAPQQAAPIRDALSQLQLAFVRIGGQAAPASEQSATPESGAQPPGPAGTAPGAQQQTPGEPGPAQRSGRLWVPGQ
jgi:hypothetical protein